MRGTWQRVMFGLLVGGVLLAIAWLPLPIGQLGQSDFFPYWAAANLLVHGRDPYSTPALDEVFRTVRPVEYAVTDPRLRPPWALGPPWTLLMVAPLGWLPFEVASRLWLLINVVLMCGSVLAVRPRAVRGWPLVPLVIGWLFVPSLIVLALGQIVVLVLVGSVACARALQGRRDGRAGAALLLALSKPQLMYLAAPAILIWAAWRGRWRVWAGLLGALILALGIFTIVRPGWWTGYLNYAGSYDFFRHAAATIGGVARAYLNTDVLRWLGVLALPLLPWLTRLIDRGGVWTGVNVALLIALPIAPYGWSYDQIVLIPAIIQAAVWLPGIASRRTRLALWLLLAAIYGMLFVMRVRGAGEFLYVWVPLALGGWYALVYHRTHRVPGGHPSAPIGIPRKT